MKINGKEIMYRSFEGYNVTIKAVNDETDKIIRDTVYIEGKFASEQQAMTYAIEHYTNGNYKAFKAIGIEQIKRKVAMYLDDYVKMGFEIDDNFKTIEKETETE